MSSTLSRTSLTTNATMNNNNNNDSSSNLSCIGPNSTTDSKYIFPISKATSQPIVPASFPEKEQSLLKMFKAEMFTSAHLIQYLYSKYESPGIHEYLVSKLYAVPHHEMDFYITFIINMVINRQSPALEGFLGELSEQNMSFYLKMAWGLQAYCECSKLKPYKGWQERMEKLERVIEMGMVNSPVSKEVLALATKPQISEEETNWIIQKFKDKEYRSNYSGILNKFVNNLIKISLYLKQHPEENRKTYLKEYIQKLNNYLNSNRITHQGIHYFQGIMIPFKKLEDEVFHSNLIVSIIEEEFICFNTKKRAPYKIIFETVDLDEMKNKGSTVDPQSSENSRKLSYESYDDALEELDDVKNENAAEIDKEIFKGLAPWAESHKKEEMRRLKKGLLRKLLSFKKRENVEQYSIHKLDKLVEEAHQTQNTQSAAIISASQQQDDQNTNSNKKLRKSLPPKLQQSQSVQESTSNSKQSKQKQQQQQPQPSILPTTTSVVSAQKIAAFNAKFPTKGLLATTRAVRSKSVRRADDTNTNAKPRSFSQKEIKIKDVVNFFKGLRKRYPEKLKKINSMYKGLNYDVIESTVYALKSSSTMPSQQQQQQQQVKTYTTETQKLIEQAKQRLYSKPNWPWGEKWSVTKERLKQKSQFKEFKSYSLRPFIVKGGDDLRQELLAMDLIQKFHTIFKESNLPLYLRPYEIIVASESSGFLEFLPNTLSVDALKKKEKNFVNLCHFYERTFEDQFDEAQKNFIESLAGYSIIAYLLQIKDRHNGNILIDDEGHIIHIDFGFILSIAPGGIKFETAHFKLTKEYVLLMGGVNSDHFSYFKSLLVRAFIEIKKHVGMICTLVSIMVEQSNLPCFNEFDMIQFRGRFKENYTDSEFMTYVEDLVKGSCDKWSTNQYDKFQLMTNGILP